ncbi:hypothetical protein J6590_106262, partial [Homalodisca vitripennis]
SSTSLGRYLTLPLHWRAIPPLPASSPTQGSARSSRPLSALSRAADPQLSALSVRIPCGGPTGRAS